MRYRYTKADRILKRREFVDLSRCGRKIHSRYFLALYRPRAGHGSRLGITVTKKVANAPGRNRVKRLVRESFRHLRHTINGCWDINIVAKQQVADMGSGEAFKELASIFGRIAQTYSDQTNPQRSFSHRH